MENGDVIMELKNFDKILERVPKMSRPMRVILAGSDGENMLKGIFAAQEKGLVQPVLVGDRARTITVLEQFGLEREPYTMVDTPPGHNITQEAIDIVNSGDGDVLMRGNIPTRDFLMPVLDKTNHLRTDRLMSHVSLASLPEYPKLLALSDMTVIIKPNMSQKKEIIRNTADALKAFGYENPKLALLSLVEKVTFHMQDTVEAQRLVSEQKQRPFADCELWGPSPTTSSSARRPRGSRITTAPGPAAASTASSPPTSPRPTPLSRAGSSTPMPSPAAPLSARGCPSPSPAAAPMRRRPISPSSSAPFWTPGAKSSAAKIRV